MKQGPFGRAAELCDKLSGNRSYVMWRALCLSLLLAALPIAAGEPLPGFETVMTKRIDGEIVIDPEGNVVSHSFASELEPAVRALLAKAVAQWKFHPYLANGIAVRARSKMRVTVAARQTGEDFQVSIDNVIFHDGKKGSADKAEEKNSQDPSGIELSLARRTSPIHYPRYAVNGMTVVAVRLKPDGSVDDIVATQTTFLNAKGEPEQFERARQAMEENATSAIRRWRFKVVVPPGVEPKPEQLTGTLLVNYVLRNRGDNPAKQVGTWRQETRSLNRSIPWMRDMRMAQVVHASDLDETLQMLPNASDFRLREGNNAL